MTEIAPSAYLYLENGLEFPGNAIGYPSITAGELIFNTSMTGYQEILTDPSYHQQTVVFTYPHIGNYGTTPEDNESAKVWAKGLVVTELCHHPSNFRQRRSLQDFLYQNQCMGIEGIDTRYLTQILRDQGCLRSIISPHPLSEAELKNRFAQMPRMEGAKLVAEVSCQEPVYYWLGAEQNEVQKNLQLGPLESWYSLAPRTQEFPSWKEALNFLKAQDLDSKPLHSTPADNAKQGQESQKPLIVVMDYGIKNSILFYLLKAGFRILRLPYDTPIASIVQIPAAALFLSNGPGDPAVVTEGIELVKALKGKIPIFGICLGHQIIANALGLKTHKMKFGHHGGNQPVYYKQTGKVFISAQNHGFAVDPESFKPEANPGLFLAGHNLNDLSNEVLWDTEQGIFSVQHHPEAGPGPHDERDIFKLYRRLLENFSEQEFKKRSAWWE